MRKMGPAQKNILRKYCTHLVRSRARAPLCVCVCAECVSMRLYRAQLGNEGKKFTQREYKQLDRIENVCDPYFRLTRFFSSSSSWSRRGERCSLPFSHFCVAQYILYVCRVLCHLDFSFIFFGV